MPGGTEAWNVLYNPVWEALVTLSHRSVDKEVIVAQRKKLTRFFEKLRKRDDLGFNQQAALKRFTEVEQALFKTESTAEAGETKPEDSDDDIGIIRK